MQLLGKPTNNLQVGRNGFLDVRPLHLDRHPSASGYQLGTIHLPQRTGRNRHRIKFRKHLLDPALQLFQQHRLDALERLRLHAAAQLLELHHQRLRQLIRTRAEDLPELDKDRPQLLAGITHPFVRSKMRDFRAHQISQQELRRIQL